MTATRIRRERPGAVKMSPQFSRVLSKSACIAGVQGDSNEAASEDGGVVDGLGVSIGAAAEHARGPQAGTALDSRKQPHGAALAADERAELFSLQLQDVELAQPSMVEALSRCRGSLEPSRDGVAGMARDPGGRRNAHALDAQACDLIELPSATAKTAECCPRVRAERASADCAAVAPPSARLRQKPAVAHDVEARCSEIVAPGLAARHSVDRVHCASVPARRDPSFSPTISRSTATGASTRHGAVSQHLERRVGRRDGDETLGKARQRMTVSRGVYRSSSAQLSATCLPTGFPGKCWQSWSRQEIPVFTGEREWCRGAELNCRHHDFQSCALPTELPRHARKCRRDRHFRQHALRYRRLRGARNSGGVAPKRIGTSRAGHPVRDGAGLLVSGVEYCGYAPSSRLVVAGRSMRTKPASL